MRVRSFTIMIFLAAASITLLTSTQAIAQRYSGRATAIRTTVGIPLVNPITTAINDTGPLAAAGGNIMLASASANIAGAALTAGASSSSTSGGLPAGTSHSQTSVANLNFTALGNLITATAVSSSTDCSCPAQTCTGSTTITGLMLNGSSVTVTGAVNQTINLTGPLGATGALVINEQINGLGSKTVNAIHVNITDSTGIVVDVVIASSHSDILCVVLPTFSFFSGRAYGIGSIVTTQDIVLGTSSVGTLVDDTGPLPEEGGVIGPVVVAGANIPGVATSGTLTSSTSGGSVGMQRLSDSTASVQNLAATVAGFGITATVLNSQTHCQCSLTGGDTSSTCTGGAVITNLLITTPVNGTITGTVTGAPNETVTLRILGVVVATLIFNEQIPPSPTASGAITVNALHIITSTSAPGVTTTTDTTIASSHSDIVCGTLIPTAAGVNVSGQVFNSQKRPVARARVTLMSNDGQTYSAITNPFGYFTIVEVPVGQAYLVDIRAKGYTFGTQILTVHDEIAGLVFMLE